MKENDYIYRIGTLIVSKNEFDTELNSAKTRLKNYEATLRTFYNRYGPNPVLRKNSLRKFTLIENHLKDTKNYIALFSKELLPKKDVKVRH